MDGIKPPVPGAGALGLATLHAAPLLPVPVAARPGEQGTEAPSPARARDGELLSDEPGSFAGGAPAPHDLTLELHEASGRWFVVVRERGTGRVLYTIPPEELLNVLGRIRQVIGLLLDTYA